MKRSSVITKPNLNEIKCLFLILLLNLRLERSVKSSFGFPLFPSNGSLSNSEILSWSASTSFGPENSTSSLLFNFFCCENIFLFRSCLILSISDSLKIGWFNCPPETSERLFLSMETVNLSIFLFGYSSSSISLGSRPSSFKCPSWFISIANWRIDFQRVSSILCFEFPGN